MVSPGDGQEFVYAPIGANATLHCVVNTRNTANLFWSIDEENSLTESELNVRDIFFGWPTTSEGVTQSLVRVFGNVDNSNIGICCQTVIKRQLREACTTMITYGS